MIFATTKSRWCSGSTAVSKTVSRGSIPWRGAIVLFTSLILCCASAYAKPHKHIKKKRMIRTDTTSVLVFNDTTNTHEYNKNANKVRPFASVTKLMTAMVSLDSDKDLSKVMQINSNVGGSLPRKKNFTRYEILSAMLVKSDNSAAETLANAYPGGRRMFIAQMNRKALEFGMISSSFDDPSGISANNQATAIDIGTMVAKAASYPIIREISTKKQIEIETSYKKKIRTITLNNTNRPVLFEFNTIVVSKTGFTSHAGYCLALAVERHGQMYSVVILGAKDKYDRIRKVEDIMYNHIIDRRKKELDA